MKEGYTSLSVAIKDLEDTGFTTDFNLADDGLESKELKKTWKAKDLNVIKFYRFEGMSNPSDNSILYCIETADGEKGLLVDNYDSSAGCASQEMIDKLKITHEE